MTLRVICSVALLPLLAILGFMMSGQSALDEQAKEETPEAPISRQSGNPQNDGVPSVAACSEVQYRTLPSGNAQSGSGEEPDDDADTFATPPNSDGPTVVDFGLFITQITDINEVDGTFMVEGFMDLIWCDPRLAFDPEQSGSQEEAFLEANAQARLDEIWWPDPRIVNAVGTRNIGNEALTVGADGTTEYKESFSGQLSTRYDLGKFPFDQQVVEIEIESFAWSHEHLVFHQADDKIGFSDDFEIPEWDTTEVRTNLEVVQGIRDRAPFSKFLMEIEVTRRYGFYIWKLLVPLVLIVGISWAVFWMVSDSLGTRMQVSFTGILSAIAYQFLMNNDLPKIPEMTFMDSVIAFSFILMVFTIVESIIANSLYSQQKTQLAATVNTASRVAFPLIYVVGLVALVGGYLL